MTSRPGGGRRCPGDRGRPGPGLRHPAPRARVRPVAAAGARGVPAGRGADRGPGRRRPADRLGDGRGDAAAAGPAGVRGRRAQGVRVLAVRGLLARVAGHGLVGRARRRGPVLRPAGRAGAGSAERGRDPVRRGGAPGRPGRPVPGPAGHPRRRGRLRRRRALVGGPGRVPARLLLAVPAARRGDGRAAGGLRSAEPERAAARGVHAADHPRGPPPRAGADRRGLRGLARAGAHLAAAAGQRRCGRAAGQRQAEGDAHLGAVDGASGWPAPAGTAPASPHRAGTTTCGRPRRAPSRAGWSRSPGPCASGTCPPPARTSSRRCGWPRPWPACGRDRWPG